MACSFKYFPEGLLRSDRPFENISFDRQKNEVEGRCENAKKGDRKKEKSRATRVRRKILYIYRERERETEKSLKKKRDTTENKKGEKEPREVNGRQRRASEQPARLNKESTVAAALSDRPTIDPRRGLARPGGHELTTPRSSQLIASSSLDSARRARPLCSTISSPPFSLIPHENCISSLHSTRKAICTAHPSVRLLLPPLVKRTRLFFSPLLYTCKSVPFRF